MRPLTALPLLALCACGRPFLARDGTLVFPEKGAHGASVVTSNGLLFRDVADVPERIVVRDPYEPWRAPLGFLVPASGRFTKTSLPTVIASDGLVVALRPSDTRVPSWGGEMLVRIDVRAPAAPGGARWGEDIGLVVDGRGGETLALVEAALGQLAGRDRVVVADAAGPRVIVPPMPASDRSLVLAAVQRSLTSAVGAEQPRDRAGAVRTALQALSRGPVRRVLVLSDAGAEAAAEASRGLGGELVPLEVVSTSSRNAPLEPRIQSIRAFLPASGDVAVRDVVLAFDAVPAPSHVLEASGGTARWELEGGELALGDVRAGDERTEVVRVTIPPFAPGELFELHVAVRFGDVRRPDRREGADANTDVRRPDRREGADANTDVRTGEPRSMDASLRCAYDDNVERLADSRHGDVIAYASALATLARLDASFLGAQRTPEDLRSLARMHARSLALLARDAHDPAAAEQAARLEALLGASE
jgi:hypothetical protein